MKDLAIAGGGPTGLAAAIFAARAGLDVVVHEPKDGVIDKACGEGVQPAGVAALDRLGVRPAGVPFVGIHYADAVDPTLFADGTFRHGAGLGVRRTTLHAALREVAAGLSIPVVRSRLDRLDSARFTIGADGLSSTIAAAINPPIVKRGRLGLRRHYRIAPWSERVEVYFADGAEAYVTPVAADEVGIALLFDGPAHGGDATFERLLPHFPLVTARLAGATASSKTRGGGPFERRVRRQVHGNVLLVGDAAGYIDPLTGEGIALGLRTAEAAIACIVRGTPEAYAQRYRALTRPHFLLTRLLRAVAVRRWLHAPLLHGARLAPCIFDATLDLLGGEASPSSRGVGAKP